jgi:glycosyltransferase involved in cell wall biosynthesis
MRTGTALRLNVFIAHASDCITDHLPHGDGLVAEGFIRRLAERNHRIDVATQFVALERPMPPGVTLHPVYVPKMLRPPAARLAFMVGVRRLFLALQRQRPFDLVHQLNPVFTGLSLALYGLHDNVVLGPFVPHWPNAPGVPDTRWGLAMARDFIAGLQQRHARALLITTPAALSRVKTAKEAADSPQIFEVPHGIDLARFPARTALPGTRSILFLANMWRRKGIFTLLKAFSAVRRRVPDATLTVAGRGTDEHLVRQAVQSHPDRSAITLLGNIARSDVPALMHAHAVYCLPSLGEPFGMTILEAMASGVPVVTSNCGGPGFLIDERGGRLVPPDEDGPLAAALADVLASTTMQEEMGRYNRAVAERRFGWDRVIDALEDAYYRTLTRRRTPCDGLDRQCSAADLRPTDAS